MPAEAMELAANIARLELIVTLFRQLNPLHTGNTLTQTQRDACDRQVRTMLAIIGGWKRTAKAKLAGEYLAP